MDDNQPAEETGQEAGQTETAAPQLNDAIQALQAQQAEILREVRGEEQAYEPEPDYDTEGYEGDEYEDVDEGDLEREVRGWIKDEAEQLVAPRFQQQEAERREREILALADEYPRLREPEVVQAVSDQLRALAQQTGDRGVLTDPRLVEAFYKAHEADAAAAAETPADAGGRGAVLESGAGPGVQEQEVDPVQKQYERAILGQQGADPLTS